MSQTNLYDVTKMWKYIGINRQAMSLPETLVSYSYIMSKVQYVMIDDIRQDMRSETYVVNINF